ncbi:MAG: ATP-binding protein [Myxococcaceae bacterium]|nr:ATP-binding protein [Myxococcaceae bacterium]
MNPCHCQERHQRQRIVVTGGPGAGKTAVLELVRQAFCAHVMVLPEAASILFGGGFPRAPGEGARRAAQRAIFQVQRELEALAMTEGNPAVVLCDRGTVDGVAYWPGPGDFWAELGTTAAQELARYSLVIHLRTPEATNGYNHQNPLRLESPQEAAAIDARIAAAWERHPRRVVIESSVDFLTKAHRALVAVRAEVPECCRKHLPPLP